MKSILLTGATGYLGQHLTRKLLAAGYRVAALIRPSSRLDVLPLDDSRFRIYDLEKDGIVAPFDREGKIDLVVHLATCYGMHGETPIQILQANLNLPVELFETAVEHGTDCFINSDTYYNVLDKGLPSLNDYAVSKGMFHVWAKYQAEHRKFRFINLRLEHTYGPGDSQGAFVSWAVRQLLLNPAELPLTRGEQKRDFIFIDDVVAAYIKITQCYESIPMGITEVGVGGSISFTIREFMVLAKLLTGARTTLSFGALPYRRNEIMASRADVSILSGLGWRPRISLESGLTQLIHYEKSLLQSRGAA